jgi:hypothetical protein
MGAAQPVSVAPARAAAAVARAATRRANALILAGAEPDAPFAARWLHKGAAHRQPGSCRSGLDVDICER